MNLSCNLYGLYYKCMTKSKENRVAVICNTVFVRSEADSNRCRRFCRPLAKPLTHQTNFVGSLPNRYGESPQGDRNNTDSECKYTKKYKTSKILRRYRFFLRKLLPLHRTNARFRASPRSSNAVRRASPEGARRVCRRGRSRVYDNATIL